MISVIGLGWIVFGLIIDKFCNFFFFFGDLWCEVWKMKAWVLWSVLVFLAYHALMKMAWLWFVILWFLMWSLEIFFLFVFLIGSRFRAFRLGPEGGRLDGACGAGPGPRKKTRLVNRPGSGRGFGYRKTRPEPDRLPFLLVGSDVSWAQTWSDPTCEQAYLKQWKHK